MIELKAKKEAEAKKEVVLLSKKNPTEYFTVVAVFGLFAVKAKTLHVFAPSDSVFGWYVKNGKVSKFTEKQKVKDQINTPSVY